MDILYLEMTISLAVTLNTSPYGGTAVYSRISFIPGYPVCKNTIMVYK